MSALGSQRMLITQLPRRYLAIYSPMTYVRSYRVIIPGIGVQKPSYEQRVQVEFQCHQQHPIVEGYCFSNPCVIQVDYSRGGGGVLPNVDLVGPWEHIICTIV